MTTLQELYDYTRTSLDSDADEMPDALLARWALAAQNRVFAAIRQSRWYKTTETLTTTTTTQVVVPSTLVEVETISGPTYELEPLPHEYALKRWPLNYVKGTPVTKSTPTHYSLDYDSTAGTTIPTVWFWPSPSAAASYVAKGRREPSVTSTVSTSPDMPQQFQELLGEYMVARGLEMQSNVTVAGMKMNSFEGQLDELARQVTRPPKAGVTSIGGQRFRHPETPIGRLRFSWE